MGISSSEVDLVDSLKSFSSLTTTRPGPEELFAALCDALEIESQNLPTSISARLDAIVLAAGTPLFTDGDDDEGLYVVCAGRLSIGTSHFLRGGVIAIGMPSGGATHSGPPVARRVSIVIKISYLAFETLSRECPEAALALMRARLTQAATRQMGGTPATRPRVIAIMPLFQFFDMELFLERLDRGLAAVGATAASLPPVTGRRHTDTVCERDFAARIAAAEETAETIFLIGEPNPSGWSRACIAHADEVLLLADPDEAPSRTALEEALLRPGRDADGHQHLPMQTLLLLHRAGTRSPTDTASWLNPRSVKRHIHVQPSDERHMRRLARMLTGRSVGLVLSGGGARGLAHIGVIEALEQVGIEIDMVGGTSIGAVIGGLHAVGVHGPALRAAAHRAFIASGNPIGDFHALPLLSLARGARARKVTREGILSATGTMIGVEDTWKTLFCLSTNFSAAREAPLTRGVLDAAVLASFAIPGVMPPVVIDGHLHIDGGCMNNLPVDVMRRLGAGRIIAVDVTSHVVRTYDADGVPGPWTMLLNRLRGGKRPGMPGLMHMILQAPIIQSVSRQAVQHAGADLTIKPAVRGVGLQGWKRMDRAISAGFDATLEVLRGPDMAVFLASRGASTSVPQ